MISAQDLGYLKRAFSDLLNYDADDVLAPIDPLTYRSPEGDTCLHIAALRNDMQALQILLAAGLDPNAVGDMGNTALHYAMWSPHAETVRLLLAHGASTTAQNEFGEVPGTRNRASTA